MLKFKLSSTINAKNKLKTLVRKIIFLNRSKTETLTSIYHKKILSSEIRKQNFVSDTSDS